MHKAITFILVLCAINGCTNSNQSESQVKASYNCDEGSFWVTYGDNGKAANLYFDIEPVHLDLITNASLKEYSDKTTTFWPEGRNNVYVREDLAALYHNCLKV